MLGLDKSIELGRAEAAVDDHAGFVDGHGDGYDCDVGDGVHGIDEDGPVQLPPLPVETRAVGVLLLHDADGDHVA